MISPEHEGGCWPTAPQKLLLRACLVDGPQALAYWQQWQEQTDIEHLDDGSSRLLPLLWRNLHKQGAQGEHLARYKSMSRWIWARNQRLLGAAASVIELLESEGIATLALKGGALATLYYPSLSARPMSDFDLLVPTAQAPRAFELLMRRGYRMQRWKELPPTSDIKQIARVLSIAHGTTLHSPQGQEFDLHQHVLRNEHSARADDDFWRASIALQLGKTRTRTLCAEDAFFHTCYHGVEWNEVPPLRWIADAALILRGTPDFDWDHLARRCQRHRQTVAVRQAVRYLSELDIGLAIAPTTLRQLQALPTSRAERRLHATITRPYYSRSLSRALWLRSYFYFRWNAHQPWHQRPLSFPRYMQFVWSVESWPQLVVQVANNLGRRLKS